MSTNQRYRRLNRLLKKYESRTPRGLKSARRGKEGGIFGTTEVMP